MDTLLQDLRFAVRALRRRPGFAVVVILTLAVGIGANTAIYTVLDATVLRALPFPDPDRLVSVSLTTPSNAERQGSTATVWSYPKYRTFRDEQRVFSELAIYERGAFTLSNVEEPERLVGERVSARYFPILGVTPQRGRAFTPDEDATPQAHRVAVIGHDLWMRRFGGDSSVVGRAVSLDGTPFTVVGVAPSGFRGLSGDAELWLPVMSQSAELLDERWSHTYSMIARVAPGVSAAQAAAAVRLLGERVDAAHPDPGNADTWGAAMRPLDETRIDPALRRAVLVLFGAVGLVWLIASANVANLLLARAAQRRREIAVRAALGAGRTRVVRQLLTESALLALVGGVAGAAIAWCGVRLLAVVNPAAMPDVASRLSGLSRIGLSSIRIDGSALAFTFLVAAATGLLFGLVPALFASRGDLVSGLREGTARVPGFAGLGLLGGRSILVAGEIALALVLLIGSGLMLKSLGRMLRIDAGFGGADVITMRLSLPPAQYSRERASAFYAELLPRVSALPGVRSASLASCPPLAGGCNSTVIWFRDRAPVTAGTEPSVGVHHVSPDHFRTLGVPLRRGRTFADTDRWGGPKVVLVNETAARRFWPNEDPIGRVVAVGQGGFHDRAEVVGVVGDIRFGSIDSLPGPDVFLPYAQAPRNTAMLFIRTRRDAPPVAAGVRRELRALDRNLPVYDVMTLDARTGGATAQARFTATLLAIFAAIAITLATVGIYGVIAFAVVQRTREMGIRLALGARPAHVLGLVVRQGLLLAVAGVAIGVFAAWGASRFLASLLYDVAATDPATYALVAAALVAVALLASYLPARRATRVDPLTALRQE